MIRKLIMATTALCCLSSAAQAQLTNGSFENGLEGWVVDVGTGSVNVSTDTAMDGVASLAITGSDASISQTFDAIAVSAISELSLYGMSEGVDFPGVVDVVVLSYADGTTSLESILGLGDVGWTRYDLTSFLTAGKMLSGITLYGTSDQTNYLDGITLTVSAVPEPGSLALSLMGMLALTSLHRFRTGEPQCRTSGVRSPSGGA